MLRMSVVAAAREDDRPVTDLVEVARTADRLGYPEVWIGEGGTWDAFVAAAAVGLSTDRIEITAGPVAVSVRDPITIGRGAATAATLSGRSIGVALGASSVRFVEGLHGRSRSGVVRDLDESAAALAQYLHEPTDAAAVPGFRRKMGLAGGLLTVAAFGDRAIDIAARHADRMLLDLVTPDVVAQLREKLEAAAARAGRPRPPLAAWLPAAVDPGPAADRYVREGIAGYLAVRGYDDMFVAAGFGEAVDMASAGRPARRPRRRAPGGRGEQGRPGRRPRCRPGAASRLRGRGARRDRRRARAAGRPGRGAHPHRPRACLTRRGRDPHMWAGGRVKMAPVARSREERRCAR